MATFGNNAAGSSWILRETSTVAHAGVATAYIGSLSVGDTINTLSIRMAAYSSANIDVAVYLMSSGLPTTKVCSATLTCDSSGTMKDYTSSAIDYSVTTAGDYCVAVGNASGNIYVLMEDPSSNGISVYNTSGALPSTWSHYTYLNYSPRIWATYTPQSGGTIYSRTLSDTVNVLEIQTRGAGLNRATIDGVSVIESLARYSIFNRNVQESVSVLDSLASQIYGVGTVYARLLADTVSVYEVLSRSAMTFRTVPEAFVSVSDIASRSAQINRISVDAAAIADATERYLNVIRNQSDSVQASDELNRQAIIVRVAIEAISITEAILRSQMVVHGRNIQDTISVSDEILRAALLHRVLANGIDINDELLSVITYTVTMLGMIEFHLANGQPILMSTETGQPVKTSLE